MIRALILAVLLAGPVAAQDFSGLARVDPAQSRIADAGEGLTVRLSLSQTVPYRVFTLDEPRRLVVDFREVDWSGLIPEDLLVAGRATDLHFGPLRPGWSRLIVDLAGPFAVRQAGLTTGAPSGAATLVVALLPTDDATFAAQAGAPDGPEWTALTPSLAPPVRDDGPLTVAIDPGHGGIDPGAMRGEVHEADLMLQLAIEVADAINRTGTLRAVLTRNSDIFVPLEERMTRARAAGAGVMVSLHADALDEDQTRGASVYTLNEEGKDRAAQRMAERHERGDLLAGLDLTGHDDRVATVLMDMARADTAPASHRLADTVVAALRATGAAVNSRPRRDGRLAVLNAADFPSVLLEAGFLSNARDRAALSTPAGRAAIVKALTSALQTWAVEEAARAPLKRQ